MNRMNRVLASALACLTPSVWADQFHYHNLVVGERAMGLGGAFCAVSDDASGVIYNPAGIAFALSNDITGSANAYYSKKVVYKKTLGTKDFTEKSGGTLAPFFGGMQKMDSMLPGLAFAFGLYAIDSELKDQNDLEFDIGSVERFHRTANIRGASTGLGGALAKRLGNNFAIGLSLSYIMIDELIQEYQDVQYKSGLFLTQNFRTQLKAGGLDMGLGMQYALGTWSFGINIKNRKLLSDVYEVAVDLRTNNNGDGVPGANSKQQSEAKIEDALGSMPTEIRAGTAWFPSASFLWSFDVIHNTEAKSDKVSAFDREAVTNFATGAEYYITPSIPVRTGLFTNYDTRPEVQDGKTS